MEARCPSSRCGSLLSRPHPGDSRTPASIDGIKIVRAPCGVVWRELLRVGAVVPYGVGAGVRGRSPESGDRVLDSRTGRDFWSQPITETY